MNDSNNEYLLLWSIHQAMDQLNDIHKYITTLVQQESHTGSTNHPFYEHLKYMSISHQSQNRTTDTNTIITKHSTTLPILPLSCYTTVWRRPFYIRGIYTKIYRTISQTPFFVIDDVVVGGENGNTNTPSDDDVLTSTNKTETTKSTNHTKGIVQNRRRRLGTTSVEEVITPYILQATNGVATHNNNNCNTNSNHRIDPTHGHCDTTTTASGVVYGMAKFHASGREDMNVRMLLPLSYDYNNEENRKHRNVNGMEFNHTETTTTTLESTHITGRPFVYETYDALRLPRLHDLQNIVASINHIPTVQNYMNI